MPGHVFLRFQNFFHDDEALFAGKVPEVVQILCGIVQAIHVVDPHSPENLFCTQPPNELVKVVEHIVVVDIRTDQAVDKKESPVIDTVVGVLPRTKLLMMLCGKFFDEYFFELTAWKRHH